MNMILALFSWLVWGFILLEIQRRISNKGIRFVFSGAVALFFIGLLFKVMHWPYANAMCVTGGLAIAVSKGISLFSEKEDLLNYVSTAWLFVYSGYFVARVMHWVSFDSEFMYWLSVGVKLSVWGMFLWFLADNRKKEHYA